MTRVLFVCLGNICRSPMAEAIFAHLVEQAGLYAEFEIDSAGTSNYHPGKLPDQRTTQILKQHGIQRVHHARQVTPQDFETFDYILAMDQQNWIDLQHVQARARHPKARLERMNAFDHQASGVDVPDPYYDGLPEFEAVYQMLLPACQNLLKVIRAQH